MIALSPDAARCLRIGAYHWLWRGRAVVGTLYRYDEEVLLDEESAELVAAGLLEHVGEQDWHSRHADGTYAILAPTALGRACMAAIITIDMLSHKRAGDLAEWERAVRSHSYDHLPTRKRAELLAER